MIITQHKESEKIFIHVRISWQIMKKCLEYMFITIIRLMHVID